MIFTALLNASTYPTYRSVAEATITVR